MATNKQLKFYRKSTAPASPAEGAIWFNTSDKTIQIYANSAWEKYAGNLKDATWSGTTLTITKHDGSSIALNFSDMASAAGVKSTFINKVGLVDNHGELTYEPVYNGNNNIRQDIVHAKAETDKIGDVDIASTTEGATAFAKIASLQTQISAITGDGDEDGATLAGLAVRMTEAEGDIDDLEAKVAGLDNTTVKEYVDDSVGALNATTIKMSSDSGARTISEAIAGGTKFVGVVSSETELLAMSGLDNGDIFVAGSSFGSSLADYMTGTFYFKEGFEYIVSTDESGKFTFYELGNADKNAQEIVSLNSRITPLESWKTEMTKDGGTLATINSSVSSLDTQLDSVDGITGFDSDTVNKATYTGTNYINSATTLKDADTALDAALKSVSDRVAAVETEVSEVVGDEATITVTTDANGKATVSAVTSAIAVDSTGLAAASDVFDALCWVEFE